MEHSLNQELTKAKSYLQPVSQSYHLLIKLEAPRIIKDLHLGENNLTKRLWSSSNQVF